MPDLHAGQERWPVDRPVDGTRVLIDQLARRDVPPDDEGPMREGAERLKIALRLAALLRVPTEMPPTRPVRAFLAGLGLGRIVGGLGEPL